MGVINKEPFIVQVFKTMTVEQLSDLKLLINGKGPGPVHRSLVPQSPALLTEADKGTVKEITLELSGFTSEYNYKGYLIYNNSYCVLITYSTENTQQLPIIDMKLVDGIWQYQILNNVLTIDELRYELDDAGDVVEIVSTVNQGLADGDIKIKAGNVEAKEEGQPVVSGKVLMADGEGGAEWGEVASAVSITYAALKTLRDGGKLVPGTFYRITDFVTTTAIFGTHSAGHQFDVIVRADSASVLNENAWAIQHEGDTYFANSKLSAWRLWYCLDNDTNRFAWADTTNGKGVIYRMIDEFNNDIPYDFKNIIYEERPGFTYSAAGYNYLFARDSSLDANGYYGWRTTGGTPYGLSNPYCFTTVETPSTSMAIYSDTSGSVPGYAGIISEVFTETHDWYTFTVNNTDGSLLKSNNIYGNVMKPWTSGLNKNIFKGTGCHSNIFEENCYSNTFGQGFDNNVFGDSCYSNTFGNSCHRNLIGNECYKNTFANYCSNNKFGNDCCNNTFDGSCSFNVFVSNCQGNIFAGNCSFNTFDIGCFNNTFGKSCSSITFGNDCDYIALGNSSTATLYYEHITIDNGCRYLSILANGAGAYNSRLQNVHICSGVKGASNQNPLTITTDRGLAYETTYKATGSTEVIL